MNDLLGQVFTGLITDENEEAYFVQKNGVTFQLAKTEGEHKIGDPVEGFAYVNQKKQGAFTTEIPAIKNGQYGFAEVIGVRKDLGVFVNIGLPDKDVVVSLDELPTMKELWPKKGDRLMITLRVDDKDRMWGTLADENVFHAMARKGTAEMKNKDVKGTVYRLKVAGTFLITDDLYLGFIHPSERYSEPRLGEVIEGRVVGLAAHDNMLNISLKPRSHEMIDGDAGMLLAMLERSENKMLPYGDKSGPDEIKAAFGISKGQFKRAIGALLKAKKIEQRDNQIYLKN